MGSITNAPIDAEFCINDDGPTTARLKIINTGPGSQGQIYYNGSFPWNGTTGELSGQNLGIFATNATITAASNGSGVNISFSGIATNYAGGNLSGSVDVTPSGVGCLDDE